MDYPVKFTGQTTTATPKEIYQANGQRFAIATSTAYRISGAVVALDAVSFAVKEWDFDCLIQNIAGTVALVGSATVTSTNASAAASTWGIAFTADDTNNALAVTVTGATGRTIDWNVDAEIDAIGAAVPASSVVAAVSSIVLLNDVKNYLSITLSDTTKDDFLQTYINAESLRIEAELVNKVMAQTQTNEIGNGNGRARYRPMYYPIIDIGIVGATDAQKLASVQYDVDGTWTDIETDVDNIIINNPVLGQGSEQNSYNIELLELTFEEGTKNIRLTYQAGYSTAPSPLWTVCLERVVETYQKSYQGGKRFGLDSVSKAEGGGSTSTRYTDFSARHEKMMKPYRRTQ